jgi:hypothetical protein
MASRPPKLESASVQLALRMLRSCGDRGASVVEAQIELGLSCHTVRGVLRALLNAGLAAKSHQTGDYVRWCVPECRDALRQRMDRVRTEARRCQRQSNQRKRRSNKAATMHQQVIAAADEKQKGWVRICATRDAATAPRITKIPPNSVFALGGAV